MHSSPTGVRSAPDPSALDTDIDLRGRTRDGSGADPTSSAIDGSGLISNGAAEDAAFAYVAVPAVSALALSAPSCNVHRYDRCDQYDALDLAVNDVAVNDKATAPAPDCEAARPAAPAAPPSFPLDVDVGDPHAYDWNCKFQRALEMPSGSLQEEVTRAAAIQSVLGEFVQIASKVRYCAAFYRSHCSLLTSRSLVLSFPPRFPGTLSLPAPILRSPLRKNLILGNQRFFQNLAEKKWF